MDSTNNTGKSMVTQASKGYLLRNRYNSFGKQFGKGSKNVMSTDLTMADLRFYS